jgi:AhpD family alkylhydroperoxidase
VLLASLRHEQSLARWHRLDPTLKTLAVMSAAVTVGCSWCVDFGWWISTREGVDPAKLRAVPAWRDSDALTDLERRVVEYAEAMSTTPMGVTDEKVAGLRRELDDAALVELTMMVAVENSGRASTAPWASPARASADRCDAPGARVTDLLPAFDAHRGCCSPSPTRCWAASPTPRTPCRTRGCAGRRPTASTSPDPRAWLVRTTTRLRAGPLTSARARRETYVGPWLPEPLLTATTSESETPPTRVVLGEQVSLALLVVLETLSPAERAVSVLQEVSGCRRARWPTSSAVEGRRPPAGAPCPGARAARRPRFERRTGQAHREVTVRFPRRVRRRRRSTALLAALAPGAVLVSDGGVPGEGPRWRPDLPARTRVARFLAAVAYRRRGHPAGTADRAGRGQRLPGVVAWTDAGPLRRGVAGGGRRAGAAGPRRAQPGQALAWAGRAALLLGRRCGGRVLSLGSRG